MAQLNGQRVLVTGASGFIGSHLTRKLLATGAEVHAVTSVVSSVYPVRLVELRDDIQLHEASLDDRSAMEATVAAAKPSYVFHLGAYTHVGKSWQRVDECIQTNIQGTVNLLQALNGNFERFIYTGTSEIYGDVDVPFVETGPVNPVSPYSVAKYAGEHYCRLFHQSYGWPIVRLRPFNAYGPAQSPDRVVPEIIGRGLRKQALKMTKGLQTREFNYVEDLADGFIQVATTEGIDGELFNLGGGDEVSMRDLATRILGLMGNPVEPEFGAMPERPTEIMRMYCDNSKVRERVGWQPSTSLDDGLAKTIEWFSEALERSPSSFAP